VTGEVSRGGSARALPATSEVMDATAGETAPVQGASEATEAHNLGQAEARNLIEYDAETGRFTWRVDCGRARAGQAAGKVGSSGYLEIQIHGRSYPAHRLAWLMVTGEWPAEYVDHVDRDKLNNRWPNLRASSASENARNITAARSNNTSGYKGVSWHGQKEKWRAEIKVHGESRFLGLFDSKEAAARAYDAAAKNLHGEFANLNFPAPATIVYPAPGVVVMEHTPPEGIVAHPYAACWPVNNIDVAGGVREPIVKIGKMILDGRGRYFAARAVNGGEGIDYPVVQYAGTDPLMDCIRWNLASRTNLHPHNLRIIADKLVKLEPDRSDEIMAAFGLETVAEAAQ
jgi:AP2 domain.